MHAVVFEVDFKPDWQGDPDEELDRLTGFVKSLPGFVRGTWTSAGAQGLSFIVFESEAAARAMADNATMPPDPAATMRSVRTSEVVRDV
jgi:hypothetical protein